MDIILTISLLASNRRDSLKRCLDSLKPLLVKIPTELIIVLTGTDGKVREIAESYTTQIIPFEWCNDFSAARNTGLNMAQGEWFLYIDDDEWFDDVSEICQFFLSGEYQNYCSAHYIQRNYQNWYGTKYSDFSAFRMVRRVPETCFQGAIHEELTPRREPCKFFKTCVHHYGYVKETGNSEKTARNIPLLLQAIEKKPEKIKNYIQLAKEADLAGEWKTAEMYCRKGLSVFRKTEKSGQKDLRPEGWLLAFLSWLISKNPGKDSAITEIESILEHQKPSQLIKLVLCQQLIYLCAEEKEPGKAVQYGLKFEELLKKMDEQELSWAEQSYGEFDENYVKAPERLYNARAHCAECTLEIRDWTYTAYFLKLLPWEKEDLLEKYYPDFEAWKKKYGFHFSKMLLEILSEQACSMGIPDISEIQEYPGRPLPAYLLLQKALQGLESGNSEEGLQLFVYCMSNAKDGFLQNLCLKEAICHQISVIPLVTQMDLCAWNAVVENVVSELPFTLNERIRVCAEEAESRFPLHSLCLKRFYLEQKLHKGFPLWEELTGTLKAYCQCISEFYRGIYRAELFGADTCRFLPADCRSAQITLRALEELEQEQMAEAVRLLGDAYHANPDMTGVITELFRQAARRMDDTALQAGEEFHQLAEQMKATLYTLMDEGHPPRQGHALRCAPGYTLMDEGHPPRQGHTLADQDRLAQAAEILNQLLPLMPEDVEMIRIRQELIRRAKS